MVAQQLALGADSNGAGPAGMTPLMIAAARGQLKKVRLLIGHGADLRHRDNLGRTAMDHAATNGQLTMTLLLQPFAPRS